MNQHRPSFYLILYVKFFLLIVFITPSILKAQHLIRGPYLTMATQHSITISWRTDIACDSRVNYGTQLGVYGGLVIHNNVVTDHVVTIMGLSPNSTYYYKIGGNGIILQGDAENYFKTLPVTSPNYEQKIRIWAVGDIAKATVNEEMVRDAFLNYVDTNYVDGYLMLGDNAYPNGYDSHFQQGFFNYFQSNLTKHTTLWPALGNHEYANNGYLAQSHAIPYFDIFTLPSNGECGGLPSNTEMYYSFNIGNAHFINLDSYGTEPVGGLYYGLSDTILSPQVQWLKQDLSTNTLPWVIVSFHHPPYCMGTHNSDIEGDLVALREKLNPILERHNVDLVLNGHCHTYQRSNMIHKHYGLETSFDSLSNIVQFSSGLNDGSFQSCPYVKNSNPPLASDSGLLYVVIGSGSDYPVVPQLAWPHNAMYYSNWMNNGSLVICIEGNKLLGEWISIDSTQPVKDRFTIYKNVNRKNYLNVFQGQTLSLKASWNETNDYVWSQGDSVQSISVLAVQDEIITVQNKSNCLRDSFFIHIMAPTAASNKDTKLEIQIYPNPCQDAIMIYGLEEGTYDCSFFQTSGIKIFDKHFDIRQANSGHQLSIEPIEPGNYIIQIAKDNQAVLSKKIVVEAK